ncbi:UDP-3-O-acyl-N-acetylglucosamine deacetylase [Candidatus Woesearchaeota archaeon]|nr:UDP-3-O-acyl-N-acetylglucosamine deacetylase [Candidatus Woesearchaeota archaeon]
MANLEVILKRLPEQFPEKQTTIKKQISFHGKGMFTGNRVNVSFLPAEVGTGIIFERVDLGKEMKADLDNVINDVSAIFIGEDTPMYKKIRSMYEKHNFRLPTYKELYCFGLERLSHMFGVKKMKVMCVEHILGTIYALGIDNIRIKLDRAELPIFKNGAAWTYLHFLAKAGIVEQDKEKKKLKIKDEFSFHGSKDEILSFCPGEESIDYHVVFPKPIGMQHYHFDLSPHNFVKEICQARSFVELNIRTRLMHIAYPHLAINGKNTLYYKDEEYLDEPRYRGYFGEEPVRHKVLDFLGAEALLGKRLIGECYVYKSGHHWDVAALKGLRNYYMKK